MRKQGDRVILSDGEVELSASRLAIDLDVSANRERDLIHVNAHTGDYMVVYPMTADDAETLAGMLTEAVEFLRGKAK